MKNDKINKIRKGTLSPVRSLLQKVYGNPRPVR